MSDRPRRTRESAAGGTAAALAIVAGLTLAPASPATTDVKAHGVPPVQVTRITGTIEQPGALVAPGQPPTPCTPGRWTCPLGTGTL